VARDDANAYFHVRTREPITPHTGPNWMWLLIDVDQNAKTGWEGFDFIVNRLVENDRTTWLEKNDGGWQWTKTAKLAYRVRGRDLHVAIPRAALGLDSNKPDLSFDFKWIDNAQKPGDILDVYISGDTAPEGRFAYRHIAR
jgi:hypothetical protein